VSNQPHADGNRAAPPAPAVTPDIYDDDYYRRCCMGAAEWSESGGTAFHGLYLASLRRAQFQPGQVVIDIGAGRGEMPILAVQKGAPLAIGVEYSRSAVALATETIADKAAVLLADCRRTPLRDGIADLVTMLDVVEHLTPDELHAALIEARRLLKPGGQIYVHTAPNRTIYDVTYRIQRLWPGRRAWPRDPRTETERAMHINEQSLGTVRQALKSAGFRNPEVTLGRWVETQFVPSERARRTYHRLARFPLTARFGVADISARAFKATE
jgi:ubiquinone/menaquinone biosynthesis C-methylase UbiE